MQIKKGESSVNMYSKVLFSKIRKAFKDFDLNRNERNLFSIMVFCIENVEKKSFSASISSLKDETMMNERTIRNTLNGLLDKGLILKTSKNGVRSKYILNI